MCVCGLFFFVEVILLVPFHIGMCVRALFNFKLNQTAQHIVLPTDVSC